MHFTTISDHKMYLSIVMFVLATVSCQGITNQHYYNGGLAKTDYGNDIKGYPFKIFKTNIFLFHQCSD